MKKNSVDFFETEKGILIENTLRSMVDDPKFSTKATYIANGILYPDNLIQFVEKHMNYIRSHPSVDPNHYMSNLRLISLIR